MFTLYLRLTGLHREHHGAMPREATRLTEAGKLRPILDPRRFDLGCAGVAFDAIASGATRGKNVVEIE